MLFPTGMRPDEAAMTLAPRSKGRLAAVYMGGFVMASREIQQNINGRKKEWRPNKGQMRPWIAAGHRTRWGSKQELDKPAIGDCFHDENDAKNECLRRPLGCLVDA